MSVSSVLVNGIRPPLSYGVVENTQALLAAKLDTDGSGGVDLQELGKLGLGAGKSDPAAFAAMDQNADGQLDLRELQGARIFSPQTLNALLGEQQTGDGLAGWLVAQGDASGDGTLSLDEFRSVAPQGDWAPPQSLRDDSQDQVLNKADRAFAAADTDGDGQLTSEELNGIMQIYAVPVRQVVDAQAMADDLMGGLDADGSGGLSKTELAPAAPESFDMNALFATADQDGDGQISAAEFSAQIGLNPAYFNKGQMSEAWMSWNQSDPATRAPSPPTGSAPSAGQGEMFRLLSNNIGRLQQQMVDAATQKPSTTA